MPSLALVALALASTSLVSAAPVAQAGPWFRHSPGSWESWQSWHPWPAQSSAPAIPSSQPNAPTPVPAGPSSQPTFASSVPTFVSSQPTIPTTFATVPSSAPTAWSSAPASVTSAPASPPSSSAPPTSSSPASGSVDASYYSTPGDGSASAFHSFFDSKVVAFEDLWNAWHSAILTNNNNDDTAVQWVSLEMLFNQYWPLTINQIHDAVAAQSASSGVSASLILSVIMQESSGAIGTGATTDASGGSSGGMMQCNGCPSVASVSSATADQVTAMISGGVAHFQQNLASAAGDDWTSLRLYNSGSLIGTDLSNPSYGPASTPAYVEMVANRMHGWIH